MSQSELYPGIVRGHVPQVPPRELGLYLTRLFLPQGDVVLTADPTAENRQWLLAHLENRTLHIVTRGQLLASIRGRFGAALLDQAVFGLARRFPQLSAQTVITRPQMLVLCLMGAGLFAALALYPAATLHGVLMMLSLAFVASAMFRIALVYFASLRPAAIPAPSRQAALPTYTILVALYREDAVLPGLVRALKALDYPADLLDIKLVVEQDDYTTVAAVRRLVAGDDVFDVIEVPPGGPRTKPKAANYALAFARGEFLTVYDAEDRPEPDQLRKAVAAFRAGGRSTACLQARLGFYNADHNWLTRVLS